MREIFFCFVPYNGCDSKKGEKKRNLSYCSKKGSVNIQSLRFDPANALNIDSFQRGIRLRKIPVSGFHWHTEFSLSRLALPFAG